MHFYTVINYIAINKTGIYVKKNESNIYFPVYSDVELYGEAEERGVESVLFIFICHLSKREQIVISILSDQSDFCCQFYF